MPGLKLNHVNKSGPWCCPDEASSQPINSHVIGLVLPEYSGHNLRPIISGELRLFDMY